MYFYRPHIWQMLQIFIFRSWLRKGYHNTKLLVEDLTTPEQLSMCWILCGLFELLREEQMQAVGLLLYIFNSNYLNLISSKLFSWAECLGLWKQTSLPHKVEVRSAYILPSQTLLCAIMLGMLLLLLSIVWICNVIQGFTDDSSLVKSFYWNM